MGKRSKMWDMKEEMASLASECKSMKDVLEGLGYKSDNSGNYQTLKAIAKEFNIDLPRFNPSDRIKAARASRHIPLEDILVADSPYKSTSGLKKRLLKEGVLVNECSAPFCPVPNPSINPFSGEVAELKLALDHIDGDRTNNRLDNLRLLCYHCHGLTPTYCRGARGSLA